MADNKTLSFTQAHPAGLCDVAYIEHNGVAHLITCGQDGKISFRNVENPGEVVKSVQNENNGSSGQLHCIKASPCDPRVVVGDEHNFVKSFSFPSGDLQSIATRFTLPVKALAFSPSGATLAAAGDDEGIKLVEVGGNRVFRTLKSQPYTRGLAYDPEGSYVAGVSADGCLSVWEIATGKLEFNAKKVCPKVDTTGIARSQVAWHPDGGSVIAAPGTANGDVVFYERLSWEISSVLEGEHTCPVSLLAYSKNGLYLATASKDQYLVIWDVTKGMALEKRLLPGAACGIAWHPVENALALITEDGEVAVWQSPIPRSLPGPNADVDALAGVRRTAEVKEGTTSEVHSISDEGNTIEDDGHPNNSHLDNTGDGNINSRKAKFFHSKSSGFLTETPPQAAVQPGSTALGVHGRRYLAYTSVGAVMLKEEDDHNVIEVSFHDTNKVRKRIPLLTDFFGISLGSLCEKGALCASRSNADSPSTVVYRAFESWGANADWTVGLPPTEEAECIAVSDQTCAIATSKNLLRLFSLGGLQTRIIVLPGSPVALCAEDSRLAAVWHSGVPSSKQQMLDFAVYDTSESTQIATGRLPLSHDGTLVWIGFSSPEGIFSAYDSKGTMCMYTPQFGGSWVPVFSAARVRKGGEHFWPVGTSVKEMQCIVCADGAEPSVPSGGARPVVTLVPLQPCTLLSEEGVGPLEGDVLRHSVAIGHYSDMARRAQHDYVAEAAALRALEAARLESDRASLRLLTKLIVADHYVKAYEVVERLHGTPSVEGALKLATHHRANALANKISALIEATMEAQIANAEADQKRAMAEYHDYSPVIETLRKEEAPSASIRVSPKATIPSNANPFSRSVPSEAVENGSPNGKVGLPLSAGKRKGAAGNPFARKSKSVKL